MYKRQEVGLGDARDDDTREASEFYSKITEVREALRGAEHGTGGAPRDGAIAGIEDR